MGPTADFATRSNDTWISTKVKTDFLARSGVPSGTILTTTSQGVVYLMGHVTAEEADKAANSAAGVQGVVQVVKVFDITTTPDSLTPQTKSTTPTTINEPSTTGGTQTFPLNNGN